MTYKNPVKNPTTLTINGTPYSLVFDLEAVSVAEDLLDRPLLVGLRARDINTPTITLVRAMLFACIRGGELSVPADEQTTFEQVKALVTRSNVGEVWASVLQAWTAGLGKPDSDEDDSDESNPTQDQR
jgi:hypothetical protein